MEDAMIIATKGLIGGSDITIATKGILFSSVSYWFGLSWREVVSLYSVITKVLNLDSPINGD